MSSSRRIRNPMLAASVTSATRNSLVSTVRMILRGSIRPLERRVGVEIGLHPLPPIASREPATKPNGEEPGRDRPQGDGRLAPPEREAGQDVDAEAQEEDRHERLRGLCGLCGLCGDETADDDGPERPL